LNLFFDASALVKRYLSEPGSATVARLVRARGAVVVSDVSRVEVRAAVWRRVRARDVPEADARRALSRFEEDFRQVSVIEARRIVLETASTLVELHPLRAYDAIQLASALTYARRTRRALTFVSADAELNSAARSEGLRVARVG